eukprot:jgi/Bigna1/84482/fgenesh1_pg.141_\
MALKEAMNLVKLLSLLRAEEHKSFRCQFIDFMTITCTFSADVPPASGGISTLRRIMSFECKGHHGENPREDPLLGARCDCDGNCSSGKKSKKVSAELRASSARVSRWKEKATEALSQVHEEKKKSDELDVELKPSHKRGGRLERRLEKSKKELVRAQEEQAKAVMQRTDAIASATASRTEARKLTEKVEALRNEIEVPKLGIVRNIDRQQKTMGAASSKLKAQKSKSKKLLSSLNNKATQLSIQLQPSMSSAEKSSEELSNVKRKHSVVSNRAKNRGRALKKHRAENSSLKKELRNSCSTMGPKRKPKDDSKIKRTALIARRKAAEFEISRLMSRVAEKWCTQLSGCGASEFAAEEECFVKVAFRKGTNAANAVGKFLHSVDSGLSKKKLHEVRMLSPAVPSTHSVKKMQDEMDSAMESMFCPSFDANHFAVHPEKHFKHIFEHRGLENHTTCDTLLEGDGRGTGNSFKSVTFQARISNAEGRPTHREDRQCTLALLVGDENGPMLQKHPTPLFTKLKNLQECGFVWKGCQRKVRLHHTGDAKWMKVIHGVVGFHLKNCNCLHCHCHAEDGADVTVKWAAEKQRFSGPLKEHGRQHKDLLPFTPMERRWSENMHLVFRFLRDKIMAHVFTDIVNTELGTPQEGMKQTENDLQAAPFDMTKFKFRACEVKDRSAAGGFTWATPKMAKMLQISEEWDFERLHKVNPGRGELLQKSARSWVEMHRRLMVWPGDGPELTCEETWKEHSDFTEALMEEG